ncbi:MAG: hypothetical protein ABSB12_02670 [Candidatus Saccharimonadales bacterium]
MPKLELVFTKPCRGAVEVSCNVDLHQRPSREFSIDPKEGYNPNDKDSPLLASLLQKLCADHSSSRLGIKYIHVTHRRIVVFHRHAIEPTTIRDQMVEVLPIHYEDYVFESDFAFSN